MNPAGGTLPDMREPPPDQRKRQPDGGSPFATVCRGCAHYTAVRGHSGGTARLLVGAAMDAAHVAMTATLTLPPSTSITVPCTNADSSLAR